MRLAAKFSAVALTTVLMAGEVDPKLLRLIGPDTKTIYGIDVERYRNSKLSKIYPVWLGVLPGEAGKDQQSQIRQLIVATAGGLDREMPLMIFRGALPVSRFQQSGAEEGSEIPFRVAVLDTATGIAGGVDSVREAMERWRQETSIGDFAAKVRQVSGSYDNWFLAMRPLEQLDDTPRLPGLKRRKELMGVVEEARGGIRFGAVNEVSVEVVMKAPEDAEALVALARWLPGLIEARGAAGPASELINVVENLAVRADGRVVSISFSIAESSVENLLKSAEMDPVGQF
jgi:hypothetical protein